MPIPWNAEQIVALAPDPSSAKAGHEQARAHKWRSLGHNPRAAWGECQGSAKEPYQTCIDLNGPAFKCTCPSRKTPCKHALGLLLLLSQKIDLDLAAAPPPWAAEWLQKRDQREAASPAPTKAAPAPAAQARRAAQRAGRVRQGLADLDTWLCDLLRRGLTQVQNEPLSYWDAPAARLVDAQAPALARRLRNLALIPATGQGWQERLLEQIALLYLLIEGYNRLDELSPAVQADIRTNIGWTQDQEELLQQDGLSDCWLVLGNRIEEEAGRGSPLKVQRTWLWGLNCQRPACLLSFAAGGQPLEAGLPPGAVLDSELVFFPGNFPLRALPKQRPPVVPSDAPMPGFAGLEAAFQSYHTALAANPWLELYPLPCQRLTPCQQDGLWQLRDEHGRGLALAPECSHAWKVLALSGGEPIALFGEWNGRTFWPLSAQTGARWIAF